jgi:hypothetical protein
MEEKRRLKRRHLIFYLRIFDARTNQLLGYLVDLTPEGIMLMSEHKIERGKKFKLKMDLPSEYSDRQQIEFDAESVWNSTDINPDFYDTGFKFSNVTVEEQQVIEDIIDDLGFEDKD